MKIAGAIGAFIVLLIILIVVFASWGTVPAGSVGVVLRMGAVTGEIKQPGFYTRTPFAVEVISMNCQEVKEQVDTECSSKDLQIVKSTVSLNLSLVPEKATQIYQNIGMGYLEVVVAPAMQESVKAVMAQYTAEELISKREEVRQGIADLLATKLSPIGIKTEAVNMVNFNFSDSFEQAIEAKVTTEQNALAAKNKLEQIKYEADQNVARAEGEAKAIAIQAQAIQVQGGAAYIELKALEKWDGRLPQVMGAGAVPFINTALTSPTDK